MYSKKSLELLKKYDEKSSSEKTGLITNETRANAERAKTEAETKSKKTVSPTFFEDLERVKERDKNAQILPRSSVKRVYSKAGTTPAETLGHSAGYTAETALAGALGALEDVGDFGLSVLESLGYGIFSLGGLKQNAVSDKFKEWFEVQNTKKDISDYWRESAERRYSGAHSGIKKLGDTLQSAGAMAPSMAVALMTGGGSAAADYTAKGFKAAANTADAVRAGMNAEKYAEAWQAARDMARYAKNGAKAFFEPSSALFGMSAAGSSTEDAYRRSGDMGRSLAYGTMSGIGEMATEKIFGGFAGTDVGESLIDFNIKNPYVRKAVNTATEALEEQIMTGLDPIMLRASGVDRNAELATLGEYAESGLGGVTLSAIMNAAMLPIKKVGRANSVKILNEASEEINKYAANDNDIMKPLSKFASDSEIQKRQEELTYYTKNLVNKIQNKEKQASQQEGQRGAENKQGAKSENPPSDISETGKGEDISGYDDKGTVHSGKNKVVSQWGKNIGENGRKAYKDNIREDTDIDGYTRGFVRYYDLGLAGVPFDTVKTEMEGHIYGKYLTPDQGYAAYYSGVNDAKLSLENEKSKVKTVDYFSDDAGIVDNEHLTGLDEKFVKATDKLVRGLGVQAMFTDEIEGGKLNGFMDERGKMVLSRDSSMTYASLAGHEITHRIQQLSPEEYRTYRDYVINEVGADRVDEYRTKLNEAGYYIGEEQLLDEIAADFTGEKLLKDTESISDFVRDVNQKTGNLNIVQRLHKAICDFLTKVKSIFKGDKKAQDSAANEAFGTDTATLERARDLLKKAYDNGVKEIERRKGQEKAQDIDLGDGVKYSVKETFAKQVDDTLNKNVDDGNHVYVSETTDIMKKIGFNDKPMLMTRGHLRDMHHEKVKGITKYHGMSEKTINKLPEILKHPAMIFDSLSDKNSDAVCMLSEITDSDGLPILVAIKPDGTGKYNNVTIESNFILSAYGKNGAQGLMDKLAQNKDKIIFADKERTQEMLKAARLYLPAGLNTLKFNTIIHQSENIVNSQNVSNSKNVRNGDGVKYSVKHTTDNRPVAVVDEDILDGTKKSDWIKSAKEAMKKFSTGIPIGGRLVKVNKITRDEYTNSKYTQKISQVDTSVYKDKLNASGSLDEIVLASDNYVNEDLKHKRKDSFVQFARGDVLLQSSKNKYKAKVVIGITANNEMVLYDVIDFDRTDFDIKKSDKLDGYFDEQKPIRLNLPDNNNISQSESVVNSQYTQNGEKNAQNTRKFSVKGTENILGDAEKLRQLEGRLAQEYLNLKGEAGKSISKAEFGKAAKSILDELGLAYKKEQLAAEMEDLAKDTRNGMRGDASGVSKQTQEAMRGEMDFETFRGKVKEIAENIIDSESVRDSEAYASTSELREYLRTTPIKVDSETRANLGEEYESIRKKNFGRLRLNQKEGLDIGTAYSELELLFPEFFNTATETNGTEQLRNISDVIEQVKALNDNPYNGYRDEAVEWLSNMLIDKIYDVGIKTGGNSVRITADMNELRNNAAEAFQRAADADRKWRDREYDKMRRGFEEKFKQKNIALNKKYEKMSDGLKEKDKRRTEYRDKLVKMKQIRLHTERISKMLVSPSDKTAVPEFLRKPVADFLSCIDLKNDRMGEKTTVRLNELQKLYQHISDGDIDANLIVDPDLANNIETIVTETEALGTKDKALTSLSNETLETMRQAAMAIERSVSTYNKAFREGKGQQIYQLGESVAADMRKRKDYKGSKNGILQANADLLNMDMLNPWDFFHMLGPTAEGLYGELRAGMNKQTEYLNKAKEQMNTLREKFGVDADVSKVITEYKTENGDTIPLSKAQVMSLYCLIRRSAAREHILLGGIRPDGVDKGVVYDENGKRKSQAKRAAKERRVSVTAEDVRRITDSLSENEKEFAKGISDYFSSVCAEQGNEVSLQLYGYKKYSTQNYFPIVSDDSFIKKEHGAARDARLKNKSFSKNTVMHANNPIIVRDIFDVYAQHTSDMASYSAFVLPIQDMERVFNVKGLETGESVRELLEQKFGRRAGAYFDNFMEDINGGAKYEDGNKLINKAISNYKSAKIGANLRVAVQQPMSYIRAAAVMDSKYLAEAFAPGSARKVDLDTVYKYAPIARWKDWGFFSMDTGKDMKGLLLDKKQLSDYTMALAGKLDQVTWKRIWRAVELETAEKHSELAKGSEEFYQECGKRFDEIIDRTQVVDSTLHRSQALRSKDGLVKVSTSFMSEPLKTYNLLRTAAADYKANPSKQTRATFIRTGAVCLISSVANAVVTGAYDTLKGDEDENFWENAVSNFVGDWTGMVPVYKDIFSVIEGFTPKRMELQGIGDFVASFKRACSDKYTKAFVVSDLIMRFADLCGIPATSLKTSVYDLIIKNIFRRIDNQWLDYNLTKQMYRVANPDNKSKFTDVLFEAWQKGHKEQYDKIVADMIDNGIDAKTINTRLKTKYKKFTETAEPGTIKGFDVPWDNKSEIPTQKTEDKFGLENLNSKQYAKYEKEAVSLEREVVGTVENYKGEFNSQDYNSMLSAAYDYVTETALESASGGEYETGSNWIANAQEAAEYGLEPAEYIKYKQEYGARALAIDKLRDITKLRCPPPL